MYTANSGATAKNIFNDTDILQEDIAKGKTDNMQTMHLPQCVKIHEAKLAGLQEKIDKFTIRIGGFTTSVCN